jgi:hypothetical protein
VKEGRERHTNFLSSIVMAVVSSIDLNTLDSLSRTCRGIHNGLIQYRSILLSSTLRCSNEATRVDPDETFRFRARAGNWYYMEDGRSYNGKAGRCARDMVSECRRCGVVVCRVSSSSLALEVDASAVWWFVESGSAEKTEEAGVDVMLI